MYATAEALSAYINTRGLHGGEYASHKFPHGIRANLYPLPRIITMTTNLVAGGLLSSALGHPVTEKLTKTNYTLWKLQVLPAIRGAQLTGLIDGSKAAPAMEIEGTDKAKEPNPAYATWLAQDLLVFIVNSLSKEMMKQVSHCNTSASL